MIKREIKTKPRFDESSDYSDFTKSLTTSTFESEMISEDSFGAAVDGLSEKSAGVREKAFRHAAGLLQSFSVPEWSLEKRKETLEDGIKKGLRGTEREKCLASRLTAIFGMCTDDGEGFYNSLKDDLQNAISNSIGSSKYAAAEIIKAWATLAFIAGDEHDNLEFISKCVEWGKIESCSSECKKAIVSAIGFCTSALPGNTVVEKIIPEYGEFVSSFVQGTNGNDVRIDAAQTIALFFEFYRHENESEYDPFELDGYIDITQLLEDLEFYNSSSREQTKKLSILFDAIRSSIEEGFCPFTEQLVVENATFDYVDWFNVLQIEWFRSYLQGGFLAHLSSNELLHQVFEIEPSLFCAKSNTKEAKYYHSQSFKERSKDRRRTQRKGISQEE